MAYLVWQHEAHARGVPGVPALNTDQVEWLRKAVDLLKEDNGNEKWASASKLVHPITLAAFSGACILCTLE